MKKQGYVDPRKILPFGENFLFIDKLISYEENKNAVTEKLTKKNEWFFKSHFPGNPVMPGHLIAEAMVQTCALCLGKSSEKKSNKIFYLASSKVRFYKTVRPGDKLTVTANAVKILAGVGIFAAEVRVKNKIVSRGKFILASRGGR